MSVNSLRAAIAAWLNASQISRFVDGMNRSTRGVKCKAERTNWMMGRAREEEEDIDLLFGTRTLIM